MATTCTCPQHTALHAGLAPGLSWIIHDGCGWLALTPALKLGKVQAIWCIAHPLNVCAHQLIYDQGLALGLLDASAPFSKSGSACSRQLPATPG